MIRLRVREVAKQKEMSMRKLASKAGIAYNTLRTIYRDPYRQVTTTTLEKLAQALEVPVVDLIEETNNKDQPENPSDQPDKL